MGRGFRLGHVFAPQSAHFCVEVSLVWSEAIFLMGPDEPVDALCVVRIVGALRIVRFKARVIANEIEVWVLSCCTGNVAWMRIGMVEHGQRQTAMRADGGDAELSGFLIKRGSLIGIIHVIAHTIRAPLWVELPGGDFMFFGELIHKVFPAGFIGKDAAVNKAAFAIVHFIHKRAGLGCIVDGCRIVFAAAPEG